MIWLEITLSRIFPVIQKPLQLSTSQASCTRNSETRLTRIPTQYYPWKTFMPWPCKYTVLRTIIKTIFLYHQMISYFVDTLPTPIRLRGNLLEFFWVEEDLCHFIKHLVCARFFNKLVLRTVEFLSVASLVVLVLSLWTQWCNPFSVWTSESPGTRRCRPRRALDVADRKSVV